MRGRATASQQAFVENEDPFQSVFCSLCEIAVLSQNNTLRFDIESPPLQSGSYL